MLELNKMRDNQRRVKEAGKDELWKKNSKNYLRSKLTKKMQTIMIGALDRIEKKFGYLWGAEKENDDDLTDEEYDNEELWQELRKEILDNGNKQIREMHSEISQYNITFNKYKMILKKEDEQW